MSFGVWLSCCLFTSLLHNSTNSDICRHNIFFFISLVISTQTTNQKLWRTDSQDASLITGIFACSSQLLSILLICIYSLLLHLCNNFTSSSSVWNDTWALGLVIGEHLMKRKKTYSAASANLLAIIGWDVSAQTVRSWLMISLTW